MENRKKIAVVIGTRPEGVKLCPLILAMRERGIPTHVITSGQHNELLEQVLEAFSVQADISLPYFPCGEDMGALVSALLSSLSAVFRSLSPSLVIVQGDTATAYSAALSAFLLRIPIMHVEAGLRTGDPFSPFPEEGFRKSIAAMSFLHIAPSEQALLHLWHEGVRKDRVFLLGNTVEDALSLLLSERPKREKQILLTLHRREHSEEVMRGIFMSVARLVRSFPQYSVLYPVHPSPRVSHIAQEVLGNVAGVCLSPPLAPHAFYKALAAAPLVLTDSGGVQEEAAILCSPTLVLRENTERESELCRGRISLCGIDPRRIFLSASDYLLHPPKIKKESRYGSPCDRICKVLIAFIEGGFDMPRLFQEF